MIAATRRWLRRNRNTLAIGAGVVGAGYLAGQYLISKITEARERMSSERISRENLRRRFEQNQTDCTFTVLALLPTATENILEARPVEDLTHELQRKKAARLAKLSSGEATGSEISSTVPSIGEEDGRSLSSFQSESFLHTSQMATSSSADGEKPKSKTQLWNELKINSITRTFTLIYTLSLLTLLTRIQLNLLGRRNYLSSVVSLATPPPNSSTINLEDHDDDVNQAFGNDFETNRRYLTFSWWLLHRGWKDLMNKVESSVKEAFGAINPREDLTLATLSEMTLSVRKAVEGATDDDRRSTKWLPYLLPPQDQEDMVLQESGVLSASTPTSSTTSSSLRHLLDETADLIDSPSFTHILTLLNNEAFSTLIDQKCATQAFKSSSTSQPEQQVPQSYSSTATIIPPADPSAPKAKLATILAVIARQAHSIGNGTNPPNEYLVAMEQGVRELEAFAAVVYSSNFDMQIPDVGPEATTPVTGTSSTKNDPASSLSPNPSPPEIITDLNVRSLDEAERDNAEVPGITLRDEENEGKDPEPSEATPAATAGGSGFEEVWGKASEVKDAPPADSSATPKEPQP